MTHKDHTQKHMPGWFRFGQLYRRMHESSVQANNLRGQLASAKPKQRVHLEAQLRENELDSRRAFLRIVRDGIVGTSLVIGASFAGFSTSRTFSQDPYLAEIQTTLDRLENTIYAHQTT